MNEILAFYDGHGGRHGRNRMKVLGRRAGASPSSIVWVISWCLSSIAPALRHPIAANRLVKPEHLFSFGHYIE